MPTLTTQQIADLQTKITSNDIAGFYTDLAGLGDDYAVLAGAVTTKGTSWQGDLAIAFAEYGALNNDEDITYGEQPWLDLNKAIANAYLQGYRDNSNATPSWGAIQTLHNTQYAAAGLDANDWLPNKLLNDSGDPATLWADYMTNEGGGDLIGDAWGITKANIVTLTVPPLFMAAAATDMAGLIAMAEFTDNLLNALKNLSPAQKTAMASDFTGTDLEDVLDLLGNLPSAIDGLAAAVPALLDNLGALKPFAAWVPGVSGAFADSETAGSPLVLDLDGSGVDLAALGGAGSVYWNITNGDFANASGWIAEGSGLLCIDLNEDGIINDHSELFGTLSTDGFTILYAYDSNTDDFITSADADFDKLLVWTDGNSDGYSQAEELHTLDELLITSINLDADAVNYDIEGNHISHESTFTINGDTRDIVDAWFSYDTTNTMFLGEYDLDARALFLPTLRGYGNLPDLHIAMSMDETLLEMVEDLATSDSLTPFMADPSAFETTLRDVMWRWAGVDGVSASSRGAYIDARYLEWLEEFMGREWVGLNGSNPIGANQANEIMQAWDSALWAIAPRLFYQIVGAQTLFVGNPSYDPVSDAFGSASEIDYESFEAMMENYETFAGQLSLARMMIVWTDQIIGIGNLSQQEYDDLEALMPQGISIEALVNTISGTGTLTGDGDDELLVGRSGNGTLNGNAGSDVLIGGGGAENLNGGDGNDVLHSGVGLENLNGNGGNDKFVYALGHGALTGAESSDSSWNKILESTSSGTDTLYFEMGVDPDEVKLWTKGTGNLYIQYGASDYVMIDANESSDATLVGEHLEYINFSDGTTWSLTAGLHLKNNNTTHSVYGSNYGDIIEAGTGSDSLFGKGGNDTLVSNTGRQNLDGGTGNDTYSLSSGDGALSGAITTDASWEKINESLSAGTDTLLFAPGITTSDVYLWTKSTGNLYIQYGTSDYVLVDCTTTAADETRVGEYLERIEFDGGTVWDLTAGLTLRNNNTSRSFNGSSYGDTIQAGTGGDTMNGLGGNDTIVGNTGNDTLNGGDGNDTMTGGTGNDLHNGGAGDDLYSYSAGLDTITDTAGGTDTLWITGGTTINDITVSNHGTDEAKVVVTASSHEVIVNNLRNASSTQHIETIKFDDGFSANLPSYNSWIKGTSSGETVSGTGSANVLIGYAGNDTINAGAGADNAHGGSGNDTLHGDGDGDLLHGGTGDDNLYGDDGLDTLYGGAGQDTFRFEATESFNNIDVVKDFNISTDNDRLNLADILSGTSYSHGVSVIAEWIEMTTSGSNTVVKLDRDGTGGTYSMTQIATLEGITGLTDEAALVSSGNLIAA